MSEEEQIKRIKKIRNRSIIIIILLDILIIIGILIFAPSDNCGGYARDWDQQSKNMYNETVKKYLGDSKSGSQVKQMIDAINTQNGQNTGESGKFISIHVEKDSIKGYKDEEKLIEIGKAANIRESYSGDNTQENVNKAKYEYELLKKKINASKRYNIHEKYDNGIIYKVIISENKKENEEEKKDE